ncbi:MAG: trypsin-like peptidase domain-containing protein [Thermoguttaceae bacterium]|nr:trypsin-like peptidase domain-containing protein [Thermoguttaceae bacterium]
MTIPVSGKESLAGKKNAFALAYDKAAPSVVSIRGEKKFDVAEVRNDAYKRQLVEKSKQESVTGMGSGIIMDQRGYVITNYHVVKGLQNIQVTTFDGEVYRNIEFVAHDPGTDLALLRIVANHEFTPITFGKNERVYVCEDVLAIGNPFGYANAAARGIVSGLNRPLTSSETVSYERTIQTDTPINPGNSGGPLVNLDGEMIGMNAAVRDDAQNIAFAIPVDIVTSVADRLIRASIAKVNLQGLHLEEMVVPTDENPLGESETDCVSVKSVDPGSPAAVAGLEAGDILLESNGIEIRSSLDFTRSLIGVTLSDNLDVKIKRQGKQLDKQVAMSGASTSSGEVLYAAQRPATASGLDEQADTGFSEAKAAPSYSRNAGADSGEYHSLVGSSKEEAVYKVLGIEVEPIDKSEFLRRYPFLSQVSMDNYKIMPSGGAVVTRVSDTTLFKTTKSGIQVGDVIFGFVIDNSSNNRWATTSIDILYVIARKWNDFAAESANAKVYLVRNGAPYFLDIPMTPVSGLH